MWFWTQGRSGEYKASVPRHLSSFCFQTGLGKITRLVLNCQSICANRPRSASSEDFIFCSFVLFVSVETGSCQLLDTDLKLSNPLPHYPYVGLYHDQPYLCLKTLGGGKNPGPSSPRLLGRWDHRHKLSQPLYVSKLLKENPS